MTFDTRIDANDASRELVAEHDPHLDPGKGLDQPAKRGAERAPETGETDTPPTDPFEGFGSFPV